MDTTAIMRIALDLCGMREVPADSAIGRPAACVRRTLIGIDIGEDDLRRAKAEGCDLAIAHHPPDKTAFIRMLCRHEGLLIRAGVPPAVAAAASHENEALYRGWAAGLPPDETPARLASLAEALGIGVMNIHNPCDELGRIMLQQVADGCAGSATVADLMAAYRGLPEIAASGESVELACGSPDSPLGKAVVIHGAGTNGGCPVANALFEHGVGTVIYIHLSPKQRLRLQQDGTGNLVLTGHYAADSLGMNPLLDALEAAGIEVHCCNRLIRIRRPLTRQV